MTTRYKKGSDRFYKIDEGLELPSVTTILSAMNKPALVPWAAKQERLLIQRIAEETGYNADAFTRRVRETKYACYTKLDAAGEIGTMIHDAIEASIKGLTIPVLGPEATQAFAAWRTWADEAKLEALMPEQTVYSVSHGYAGTADLIGRADHRGERWLFCADWKSSSGLYLEHYLQIAAYREAIREMGHFTDEPMHGLLVKLPKTTKDKMGEPVFIHSDELDGHLKTFLAVKEVWVGIKKFEKAA
jgi:hypothetical protein